MLRFAGRKRTARRQAVEPVGLCEGDYDVIDLASGFQRVPLMGGLLINGYLNTKIRGGLGLGDSSAKMGAYVIVTLDNHSLGRTKPSPGANPTWDLDKTCFLHGYLRASTTIYFTLFEHHRLRNDFVVGSAQVLVNDLLNAGTMSGSFPLRSTGADDTRFLVMDLTYTKDAPGEDENFPDCPKYNITNLEDTPTPLSPKSAVRSPVSSPRGPLLVSPATPRSADVQGMADAQLAQAIIGSRTPNSRPSSGRMSGFLLTPRRKPRAEDRPF